jgi:phage-related minor tail protein
MTISSIFAKNIEAYSSIPFVGLALGIAGGVAAIAAARSGAASKGGHAFAEGGIVNSPVLGLVGEAGPEVILPLDRLGQFVQPQGGNQIVLQVNNRTLAEWVVKEMPAVLRLRGMKG